MAAGERTVKIKFTGDAKGLNRAEKDAEKDIDRFGSRITKALQNVTDKLPDFLSGAISSLPPQGQALALVIVGGLAAALAPLLGAAITSALLVAVGGGVLALGIKSAIDDPKVAKALDRLKTKASKVFDKFGQPFEAPLIRAAGTFAKLLDDLRPQIVRLGRLIAPVIDKLAPALAEFFRNVMPGITDATAASVPLFETLAKHLPKIGEAIGIFFSTISENGDDANVFFGDLLELIEKLIIGLGVVIAWLAKFYSSIHNAVANAKVEFLQLKIYVLDQLGKLLDGAVAAFGFLPDLGPKLKTAQKQFANFRADANKELASIKDRQVKVTIWSNIASVVADIGARLASIKGSASLSRRASGGPVSAGRSYLVGERGPEILTMGSTSGNISPNSAATGPDVLQLVLDLGEGIKKVVQVNLREHDRGLKRRTVAATGAMA